MAESKPEKVRSGGVAPEAAVAKIVPEPAAKDEFTVFYAWQSDLRSQDNRSFIESALETALKNIQRAGSIQQSPRLDKDTQGVSGIPDIASTILDKIRAADAFVADASFVAGAGVREGSKGDGDRVPNPNVMIEFGLRSFRTGMGANHSRSEYRHGKTLRSCLSISGTDGGRFFMN